MLVASAIPYAVAVVGNSYQQHINPNNSVQRWIHVGTPLFTILVVGIALLNAQKLDSYSFAQLLLGVVAKTVLLRPAWMALHSVCSGKLGTSRRSISRHTSSPADRVYRVSVRPSSTTTAHSCDTRCALPPRLIFERPHFSSRSMGYHNCRNDGRSSLDKAGDGRQRC